MLFGKFRKRPVEVMLGSLVLAHYKRADKLVARGSAMYVVGLGIGQAWLRLWDPEKNLVKVYKFIRSIKLSFLKIDIKELVKIVIKESISMMR
jgi:hypothetical protein